MKIDGYVWKKESKKSRFITVFWTVSELRLACGEVSKDEIDKVEVRFKTGG